MKFKLIFVSFLFLFSCKKESLSVSGVKTSKSFEFITNADLVETKDSIIINSSGEKVSFAKKELPLKTVMVVPTSAIAYLSELNLTNKITGVSQPDFIFNPEIQKGFQNNTIIEIGTFNEIFIERILINKPDIFISTSSPTLAKFHDMLRKEGIRVLLIDEYEELSPLAKAEYIQLFGKLFGKEKEANHLFSEIKNTYKEIKSVAANTESSMTVLSNHMYGDVWYIPGGKSFQAILYNDAGGKYLWASDSSIGTLNLSFETVFEKAGNAKVWMNVGDFSTKAALLASYPNYEWFSAFKSGNIYNWSKRKTKKGANDYFETGTARPDLVLKDLAAIFHPEIFPDHELYFYKKLE